MKTRSINVAIFWFLALGVASAQTPPSGATKPPADEKNTTSPTESVIPPKKAVEEKKNLPPAESPATLTPEKPPSGNPVIPSNHPPEKKYNTEPQGKPGEIAPELDPETKRQIEEATQKILREKAMREETERREREQAERLKREQESSLIYQWKKTSALWLGAKGGLGIPLNQIYSSGMNFGGFIEYQVFENYGIRVSVETGIWNAKEYKFKSGDYTLPVAQGSTFGYLMIAPGLQYILPKFSPLKIQIGAGVGIYQVKGGNVVLNTTIGPHFNMSVLYPIWKNLEAGILTDAFLGSVSQIEREGNVFVLDSGQSISNINVSICLQYKVL